MIMNRDYMAFVDYENWFDFVKVKVYVPTEKVSPEAFEVMKRLNER